MLAMDHLRWLLSLELSSTLKSVRRCVAQLATWPG
jgi:hypothetical protein